MKALFVSNGHGEAAIAGKIASELRAIVDAECDHLAIVGVASDPALHDVGPRRAMPSGGLIAMGNARNIARDTRAGLIGLTFAQRRFLKASRARYDVVVAVGDTFALLMSLAARTPTVYVGTAKSAYVAPYGPMERRILRRARMVFVRDAATAQRLREGGIAAEAPGNAIADICAWAPDAGLCDEAVRGFDPLLVLFPGSRESAYRDAAFLCGIVAALSRERTALGALLSVAPSLDVAALTTQLRVAGLEIRMRADETTPFAIVSEGREIVRAWRGSIGAAIARATLVLGQAGTANEAAAAGGVPVVAFEPVGEKQAWYRKRQAALLGEALLVVAREPDAAARSIRALLSDPDTRAKMSATGTARMGNPGGSRAIAERIAGLAATKV